MITAISHVACRVRDGVWNCSVRDPEGNPIELWQNTPESLQSRAMR